MSVFFVSVSVSVSFYFFFYFSIFVCLSIFDLRRRTAGGRDDSKWYENPRDDNFLFLFLFFYFYLFCDIDFLNEFGEAKWLPTRGEGYSCNFERKKQMRNWEAVFSSRFRGQRNFLSPRR